MNISQQKAFTRRTYQCYSNLQRRMRETFGKSLSLPFTLGFFRTQAEPYIGQNCKYCGEKIGSTNFSLDHKIPLVRIVEPRLMRLLAESLKRDYIDCVDTIVFEWENCQLICIRCNKRKGDLTDEEFTSLVALINGFPPAAAVYVKRKLGARLAFFKKRGPKSDTNKPVDNGPLFAKVN